MGRWRSTRIFQGPKHPPQPAPPKEVVHYGDLPDPARFQSLEALEQLADEIAKSKTDPVWLTSFSR